MAMIARKPSIRVVADDDLLMAIPTHVVENLYRHVLLVILLLPLPCFRRFEQLGFSLSFATTSLLLGGVAAVDEKDGTGHIR